MLKPACRHVPVAKRFLSAVCLLLSVTAASDAAVDSEAAAALWRGEFVAICNQLAEASDLQSLRLLLLAQLALDRDLDALTTLGKYRRAMSGDVIDAYVFDYAAAHLDLKGRGAVKELADGFAALASQRELDPVDRRRYLDMEQQFAWLSGDRSRVIKLTQELNRITDWAVLGPFDNTSGSGHVKEHIRSIAFNPRQDFTGKFGQPITWFRPNLLPLDGGIYPHRHIHQNKFTTCYVRTTVKVPQAGPYMMSLGFSGDVEISVNGVVLQDIGHEMNGRERQHWCIDLSAGWNQLAFKISQHDQGDMLTVGLSQLDGRSISGFEAAADKNLMAQNAAPAARALLSPRDTELSRRADASPADAELALWNLMRAQRDLTPDQLLAFCDDLAQRFPETGLVRLQLATARRQAGSISRFEQEMSALTELAPQLARPHLYLGEEDIRRQYRNQALIRAQTVLAHAPDSPAAHQLKLEACYRDQRWQDLKSTALAASQKFPQEAFPFFALMAWANQMGDRKALAGFREEAFKRVASDGRSIHSLLSHWNKEEYGKARAHTQKLAELMPDNVEIWRLYVNSLMADGKVKEAAAEIPRLMRSFPHDLPLVQIQANTVLLGADFDWQDFRSRHPRLLSGSRQSQRELKIRQARTLIDQELKAAAAEILLTALPADPGNFQLRDLIRTFQGKQPYRETFPGLTNEQLNEKRVAAEAYAGESAVAIYALRRHFFFDGQASLHDQTLAVQILDQNGVEAWERFAPLGRPAADLTFIAYDVLKKDGASEKGEIYEGQVLFKGLAPGDVIHVRYQLPTIVTGQLVGNIWDQHLFASFRLPTKESIFELVLPTGTQAEIKTWHGEAFLAAAAPPQPDQKKLGDDFELLRWRYVDLPPVREEPGSANPMLYLPWIDVSTIKEWSLIAAWYHDLASGQADTGAEISRKAADLVAGLADADTDEKLARIFRFVANEITYKSLPFYQSDLIPRRASAILRDGFGDCKDKACLMIALGRAAGIEGLRFALCSPHALASPSFLPSPRFNHVVVSRQQGPHHREWLDPTLRFAEPGQVPRYLGGVPALLVDRFAGGLKIIEPTPIAAHPTSIASRVTLDNQGNATIQRQTIVRQVDRLADLRHKLIGVGDEELRKRLNRSLATDYPGVQVRESSLGGMQPGASEVILASEFSVPEFGALADGFLSLKLPWQTEMTDWAGVVVADEARRSPVDLRSLNCCEEEVLELVLPTGRRLTALPESKSLAAAGCSYTTQFERTPSGMRAVRTLILSGDIIPPRHYAEFKQFLDSVRRDLQRPLHLRLS